MITRQGIKIPTIPYKERSRITKSIDLDDTTSPLGKWLSRNTNINSIELLFILRHWYYKLDGELKYNQLATDLDKTGSRAYIPTYDKLIIRSAKNLVSSVFKALDDICDHYHYWYVINRSYGTLIEIEITKQR